MEDVFIIREGVSKGFGFASENSLSSKNETKPTATK